MEKMVGGVGENRLLKQQIDNQAGIRAAADPLPGPLVDAFWPSDISVDKFKVRPLVAYDWAIMKRINSPIYRQMLEVMQKGDKASEIEAEPEELWDLIFLLTRPCAESDAFFKKGVEGFKEEAKKEIGFKLHTAVVAQLAQACTDQIFTHMTTMLSYAPKPEEGEVKNFTKADPTPATDSAGG